MTTPTLPITNSKFHYYNSSQTNVQRTWAKFGWVPSNKGKK